MNHMFFLVDLLIYSTIFHCITIIYYPNDNEATDFATRGGEDRRYRGGP